MIDPAAQAIGPRNHRLRPLRKPARLGFLCAVGFERAQRLSLVRRLAGKPPV